MNSLNQTQKKIFAVAIVVTIGIICYYIYGRNNSDYSEVTDSEMLVNTQEEEEIEDEKIIVHIAGAVKNPGVIELAEDSRLSDAVNAAGGLAEDADMNKINLAYVLEDGVRINIPSVNDSSTENETYTEEEEIVETTTQDATRK